MEARLLVVEDDLYLLAIMVALARDRGYEVSGTCEADGVLPHVRTFQPHVVLLDLHMPRGDGLDLLARILAEPAAPPVIIVSGTPDRITMQRCRALGAADLIEKPFEADDLFHRIGVVVRDRGMG